jgi:hypothetical protein
LQRALAVALAFDLRDSGSDTGHLYEMRTRLDQETATLANLTSRGAPRGMPLLLFFYNSRELKQQLETRAFPLSYQQATNDLVTAITFIKAHIWKAVNLNIRFLHLEVEEEDITRPTRLILALQKIAQERHGLQEQYHGDFGISPYTHAEVTLLREAGH